MKTKAEDLLYLEIDVPWTRRKVIHTISDAAGEVLRYERSVTACIDHLRHLEVETFVLVTSEGSYTATLRPRAYQKEG